MSYRFPLITQMFGDGTRMFAMAFDGSSQSTRSVKIFDIRGCKIGVGPMTKYGVY